MSKVTLHHLLIYRLVKVSHSAIKSKIFVIVTQIRTDSSDQQQFCCDFEFRLVTHRTSTIVSTDYSLLITATHSEC